MAVAVLHNEFTPGGGCGGVCATGEIIIGSPLLWRQAISQTGWRSLLKRLLQRKYLWKVCE